MENIDLFTSINRHMELTTQFEPVVLISSNIKREISQNNENIS